MFSSEFWRIVSSDSGVCEDSVNTLHLLSQFPALQVCGMDSLTPTEQCAIDFERWVLGRSAYKLNPTIFDIWQKQILLRFIEPGRQIKLQNQLGVTHRWISSIIRIVILKISMLKTESRSDIPTGQLESIFGLLKDLADIGCTSTPHQPPSSNRSPSSPGSRKFFEIRISSFGYQASKSSERSASSLMPKPD
jgi:hypothetical protein